MISLRIKDTRKFMSHLLVKDTFDNFLLSEASINTSCLHSIEGKINHSFYSDEEWAELDEDEKKYTSWLVQKPYCFSLIKGSKVPSSMKIVMLLSSSATVKLLNDSEALLSYDNINGLFINIKYQDGHADIITGTSLNIFSLDKTLDSSFDSYIRNFLIYNGLDFEETIYTHSSMKKLLCKAVFITFYINLIFSGALDFTGFAALLLALTSFEC